HLAGTVASQRDTDAFAPRLDQAPGRVVGEALLERRAVARLHHATTAVAVHAEALAAGEREGRDVARRARVAVLVGPLIEVDLLHDPPAAVACEHPAPPAPIGHRGEPALAIEAQLT